MMDHKARRGERPTYRKPYPAYIDQMPLPPGFKSTCLCLINHSHKLIEGNSFRPWRLPFRRTFAFLKIKGKLQRQNSLGLATAALKAKTKAVKDTAEEAMVKLPRGLRVPRPI
ncbi:unnamed protein product [Prunus armeniaca]